MIQFDEHIFQMGWFNHQLESDSQLKATKHQISMVVASSTSLRCLSQGIWANYPSFQWKFTPAVPLPQFIQGNFPMKDFQFIGLYGIEAPGGELGEFLVLGVVPLLEVRLDQR